MIGKGRGASGKGAALVLKRDSLLKMPVARALTSRPRPASRTSGRGMPGAGICCMMSELLQLQEQINQTPDHEHR